MKQTRVAAANTSPGEDARERLLHAGLRLFAGQGYAQTSTRELADAAAVNVAAISYYFGDKAGLYRAVFFQPLGDELVPDTPLNAPGVPLAQVLKGFFEGFIAPLRQGDAARLCMKLRFREMLEPTGLWDEEVAQYIKPMHDTLAALLAERMGLAQPDDELHRLVVCLAGLGVHLHVGHDVTNQVAPGLNDHANALDAWADALVRYGLALVRDEAAGRGLSLPGDLSA
jgi:AcrR family transcriptional regulator